MKNKYFLSALLLSTLLGNAQETELKTDYLIKKTQEPFKLLPQKTLKN